MVRVGLIQNSIALPTTAPFSDQTRGIFDKLKPMIDAAGVAGVNILCLQVCLLLLSFVDELLLYLILTVLSIGSLDDAFCILH